MNFDKSQSTAICFAVNNPFAVITGGAGTGKTTIIKEICNHLGYSTGLCAPTGKAAARLRQATGRPASTVHSMLGYNGKVFTVQSLKGLDIIIDEASMLSSSLLAGIVGRKPRKLILVGDGAQLLPVGAGAPFHDILNLCPETTLKLSTCYRSTEAVCRAGMQVRAGNYPGLHDRSENEQWDHIINPNEETAQEQILTWIREEHLDFSKDIVLCPRNGDSEEGSFRPCTRRALNQAIVDIVNPREGNEKWRVGDRIICNKNFPSEDVWNGTTGTITAVDSEKEIYVDIDDSPSDQPVRFGKPMIREMDLAYALSVHKSQGSQYRKVVFCCFKRDFYSMINRNLIYTAITRSQAHCITIGDKKSFLNGIGRTEAKQTVMQQLARREASCS